jgi:hypothetical protein
MVCKVDPKIFFAGPVFDVHVLVLPTELECQEIFVDRSPVLSEDRSLASLTSKAVWQFSGVGRSWEDIAVAFIFLSSS